MENIEIILRKISRDGYFHMHGFELDDSQFVEYCKQYGDIVDYKFGGTLNINQSNPLGGNQFSNRSMCFHQDGVLTNSPPNLIFLYCTEFNVTSGGEHLLARTDKVIEQLKLDYPDDYDFISKATVHYISLLNNYYKKGSNTSTGVNKAATCSHPFNGKEVLFMALNDQEDPEPNYKSYFNGLTEKQSLKLMAKLDSIIRRPENLISLSFKKGDILIVDNYLMIHGRNSFPKNTRRNLQRIQIMQNVHNNR